MQKFLWGVLFAACVVAAALFVRSFRATRERLFLYFAAAFAAFALNYLALGAIDLAREDVYTVYLFRLAGFLVLIVGILDKNRR